MTVRIIVIGKSATLSRQIVAVRRLGIVKP